MLSSLLGKNNGEDNNDLTGKIMGSLGPVMAEHWPVIEPYADKALSAAQDDTTFETLARKVYPWLPMMVRALLKEDKFVSFALEHKGPLLAKLTEIKNKKESQ